LALPLFLFYNKGKIKAALIPMVIALLATNFMIFYPGTAQGLIEMVLGSGSTTPFYTPGWIPIVMLVSLIAINAKQMAETLKLHWRKQ
jgi:hypothetical protein